MCSIIKEAWNIQACKCLTHGDIADGAYASLQSMLKMRRSSATIFLLIFIPTEDLGDHFYLILCLLKIFATHSYRFYAYWRSWWVNGNPFLLYSFLFHSNFQKILFLLRSKKDHARVCQFGDLRNGVDMKWYDYMKCNKEINYIFLKEKENCRLKYE